MQFPDTSGRRRRGRVLLLASLVVAGAILALFLPQASAPLALLVVIILGLDRLRMERAMHNLADRIRAGNFDSKLEVYNGAWGEVCHAVNALLQQQRRERRLRRLVPPLPLSVAESLSAAGWPADGIQHQIVVLALGLRMGPDQSANSSLTLPISAFRQLGAAAWTCAHTYRALPERQGDVMLLCFGAFDDNHSGAIHDALQSARAIRHQLAETALARHLRCGLASGTGHVAAPVELGTSISGRPRVQALELQALAATSSQDWFLCSEEIYLHLRSEKHSGQVGLSRRDPQTGSTSLQTERRAYALEA